MHLLTCWCEETPKKTTLKQFLKRNVGLSETEKFRIRDLMNSTTAVPEWLHDIFLGYGDPTERGEARGSTLDFCDTFLSYKHLCASFPGML